MNLATNITVFCASILIFGCSSGNEGTSATTTSSVPVPSAAGASQAGSSAAGMAGLAPVVAGSAGSGTNPVAGNGSSTAAGGSPVEVAGQAGQTTAGSAGAAPIAGSAGAPVAGSAGSGTCVPKTCHELVAEFMANPDNNYSCRHINDNDWFTGCGIIDKCFWKVQYERPIMNTSCCYKNRNNNPTCTSAGSIDGFANCKQWAIDNSAC
jgi:hypothetical protein